MAKVMLYGGNFKEIKSIDKKNKARFNKRWWDFNGLDEYTCIRCRKKVFVRDITSNLGSMAFCNKCVEEIADSINQPIEYVKDKIIHGK